MFYIRSTKRRGWDSWTWTGKGWGSLSFLLPELKDVWNLQSFCLSVSLDSEWLKTSFCHMAPFTPSSLKVFFLFPLWSFRLSVYLFLLVTISHISPDVRLQTHPSRDRETNPIPPLHGPYPLIESWVLRSEGVTVDRNLNNDFRNSLLTESEWDPRRHANGDFISGSTTGLISFFISDVHVLCGDNPRYNTRFTGGHLYRPTSLVFNYGVYRGKDFQIDLCNKTEGGSGMTLCFLLSRLTTRYPTDFLLPPNLVRLPSPLHLYIYLNTYKSLVYLSNHWRTPPSTPHV